MNKFIRFYKLSFFAKTLGLLLFACILGMPGNASAQRDEQSSLYMYNPLFFNPAYAGSRGSLNITGIGRFQWVGMEGAPMTQFVSVHAPFRNQSIGVGMTMVHDRIGARERTSINADFSFAVRLNKKNHKLAFGINGGVDIQQLGFDDLVVTDPTDPLYGTSYSVVSPNFGLGVYYYGDRHYVGFSVPRLLETNVGINAATATETRHFYFTAGYVFKVNSVINFKPSTLVKLTPNAPLTFDINASFLFYDRFWVGAMYRFHEAVGLNVAFNVKDFMTIAYAYDFPINDLRASQYGTHEIGLNFDIRTRKRSFISPRYF